MKFLTFLLLMVLLTGVAYSQGSDFILLKNNHRTIKSFYEGSWITFSTSSGNYSGRIASIRKDSLFILQYDIRQVPTNLGVYVLDTISVFHLRFRYTDLISIGKKLGGFDIASSAGALFGGGILLTTVGLATWLFTKPGTQYNASPTLVIGSAALAGIGYLLMKPNNSYIIGRKYKLLYQAISRNPG